MAASFGEFSIYGFVLQLNCISEGFFGELDSFFMKQMTFSEVVEAFPEDAYAHYSEKKKKQMELCLGLP